MEEIKKQLLFLCILLGLVGILLIVYKSDQLWNISKGLPLHTNSGKCIKINNKICLAEDAGLRLNYYEASSLCRKRGMRLPTRDEAWEIWLTSENCHQSFASNAEVPKNKSAFKKECSEDVCYVYAQNISEYCRKDFNLKFPLSSQYRNGSFWLKDSFSDGQHYAVNFFSGKISSYPDNTKTLGVRCVSNK